MKKEINKFKKPKNKKWKKPRLFSKSNVKDEEVEIPLGWDTETDGLNGELLCITYSTRESQGIITPDEMEGFIELLMSHTYPEVWFAHNSQYDWRYLIQDLIKGTDYHIDLLNRTDSDIFQISIWHDKPTGDWRIDKFIPKTILRDSMALFPGSLDEFTKHFAADNLKKLKGNIDFSKERFDITNEKHVEYAIRDAVGLRSAMEGFRLTFFNIFGCFPGLTTAGSAMKAWQNSLPPSVDYRCLDTSAEKFVEQAYYGGLVFLTTTEEQEGCSTYDINSSYPAQMLNYEMPTGDAILTGKINPDHLGIYDVILEAPEDLIVPIIPTRDEDGNMQWRRGTFQTRVTSVEIEFALQYGYKLKEVIQGVYFEEKVKPFDDFINHCKAMRYEFKGTAIEVLAKLMQNSLYGKFATKTTRTSLFIIKSEDQMYNAIPVNPELGIWAEQVTDYDMKRMPHWSAFITAYARRTLLSAAYAVGIENVIYGDTDSITVKNNCDHSVIPQHQTDYGYFKLEKIWKSFKATGPKVYTGELFDGDVLDFSDNNNYNKYKWAGKIKGIPKNKVDDDLLKRIFNGEQIKVEYESTPKFSSILKGKSTTGTGTIKRVRKLSSIKNSQNWEENNGKVQPKINNKEPDIYRIWAAECTIKLNKAI